MNYFRSLKKSCLLPVAVTPQQKAACVAAGVAAFGTTAATTYWCIQKVSTYEGPPAWVTKERISQRTKDSAHQVVQTILAGATCGGATTLLVYDLNMFRKQVMGTNQCCDIIKTTMWTCARQPIYGVLFVFGVALYQTRNYPPRDE